ncbi:hypothetical protein [Clostridium botulinum]|uniref:hypothetical protein n=1 Tax=Clostridium botulinum TaxID=1491 RepID=UPI0004B6B18B|nr:hypothetical protein [Clostridium botulinum]QDY27040.1 hypothetical protein CGQ40_20260 [Clostridium botulinum]
MDFIKSNNDKYIRCCPISQYEVFAIIDGIQIPFDNPKDNNDRIIFSINNDRIIKPNGKAEFRLIRKFIKDNKETNIIMVVKSNENDIFNIEKENKVMQDLMYDNIHLLI